MMQPRSGLVFKTRTVPAKGSSDAPRKVFINCVMHELVKRPLNAAMEEVGEDHLDHMGIANLRVPLDVGEARECSDNSGEKATAIGALHPCGRRHCIHTRREPLHPRPLQRRALCLSGMRTRARMPSLRTTPGRACARACPPLQARPSEAKRYSLDALSPDAI
eukprot:Tamp_12615.p2 GENE.Tamp_12615~~Tamp_12615.p2  ORF type:complete len:163 (-),score=22.86 Tamp_12615:1134-1622(-)